METNSAPISNDVDFEFGLPYMIRITNLDNGLRDTSATDTFPRLAQLSYEKARIAALVPDARWKVELSHQRTLRSDPLVFDTIQCDGADLMHRLRMSWDGNQDVDAPL